MKEDKKIAAGYDRSCVHLRGSSRRRFKDGGSGPSCQGQGCIGAATVDNDDLGMHVILGRADDLADLFLFVHDRNDDGD